MKRRTIFSAVLGTLIFVTSSVSGQGRVIVFSEEVIEGEIEKPEAFYILSPSNLDYEPLEPEESFLDELYDTVEETPF